MLPPTSICPIVLDRQRSISKEKKGIPRSDSTPAGLSEGTVSRGEGRMVGVWGGGWGFIVVVVGVVFRGCGVLG